MLSLPYLGVKAQSSSMCLDMKTLLKIWLILGEKNILYLNVNVFSTKALIGDTIF